MSIFIGTLAFDHNELVDVAKVSILAASCVAGVLGWFFLWLFLPQGKVISEER